MEPTSTDGTPVPVSHNAIWPFNDKRTATVRTWEAPYKTLARAHEACLVRKEVEARRLLSTFTPASKVSNPVRRSDAMLDYAILQRIRRKTHKGAQVALVTDYHCPVLRSFLLPNNKHQRTYLLPGQPEHFSRHASKRVRFAMEEDGIRYYAAYLPNWDHTSAIIKSLAYMLLIPENRRHAFSMRLSDRVIRDGLESRRGFACFMQDRISRALRETLPHGSTTPDFAFVVEAVPGLIPFHLHGVIEMMALDVDRFDPNAPDRDLVAEALRKAAGERDIEVPKAKARLVDFEWLYDAAGWCSYIWKSRLSTAEALTSARKTLNLAAPARKEGVLSAGSKLRKGARDWFVHNTRQTELVLYDAGAVREAELRARSLASWRKRIAA